MRSTTSSTPGWPPWPAAKGIGLLPPPFNRDGQSRVTERWTDRRAGGVEKLSPLGTGVTDRAERNRSTMTETLSRLRQATEAGS